MPGFSQADTDVLNLPTAGAAFAQANGLGYPQKVRFLTAFSGTHFFIYLTALRYCILGFFLRGACLGGLAEPTPKELCIDHTPKELCIYTHFLVWVNS